MRPQAKAEMLINRVYARACGLARPAVGIRRLSTLPQLSIDEAFLEPVNPGLGFHRLLSDRKPSAEHHQNSIDEAFAEPVDRGLGFHGLLSDRNPSAEDHHSVQQQEEDVDWQSLEEKIASQSPLRGFNFSSELKNQQYMSLSASPDAPDRVIGVICERKWGRDVIDDLNKLHVKLTSYQVAAVLKRIRDVTTAMGFFHWVKEQAGYQHNVFTYSRLFEVLAEAKDFDTVETMMQDMLHARIEVIPHVFTTVARAYASAGRPDAAVSMFFCMDRYGCTPDAQGFNIMIDSLTRAGRQELAHDMYKKMCDRGYFPNLYTCNLLIDGFWRAGKSEEAAALFQKMKDSGEQPSMNTYNALVKVFAKSCDAQSLSLVIKEMEETGSFPNATTYNTLIGALVLAGNVDVALNFFDHMIGSGNFPNNFTYSTLIDGLGKAGKLDEAQNLFNKLKSTGGFPDEYVFNALLIHLSKAGQWNIALGTIQEMKTAGQKPSRSSYSLLVDCLKQQNKPDLVRRVLDAMQKDGFTPHIVAYHDLIQSYCDNHALDKAFQVFRGMKHCCPPDTGTYNLMLKLCSKAKDMKKSMMIFEEMSKAGLEPSVVTYSTLMQSLGKTGNVDDALRLFKKMRKKGCEPDQVAYGTVLKAMVNAGQAEKAMPLFQEGIKRYPNDLIMYSIMIDGLGKARKFNKAMALLKELIQKNVQPDVVIFNSLIASLFKGGDREEAYDIYREMETKYGCRPTGKTRDIVNSFMKRSMKRGRK